MTAKLKLFAAFLFILAVSSIASFQVFSSYVPKASEKSIKGASAQNLSNSKDSSKNFISVPFSSEEISKSVSDNGSQVVVLTSKKPSELKAFYSNLFKVGWQLDYSVSDENLFQARYKKDDGEFVNINSNKDEASGKQVLTVDYLKTD